ncbi:hypothetical protein PILCRDRAFT_816460 [Piloderma croceum F 1598]|uniref:Uncharacterized protein n=1 Tax=Piloderma croceum (strain F 1598) TaxID=765440 RepID=A0A0C3BHT7_PILCF|nr:hypothetical protein PILCRDRAFT_816460 [Piloderma croceum F 1598]
MQVSYSSLHHRVRCILILCRKLFNDLLISLGATLLTTHFITTKTCGLLAAKDTTETLTTVNQVETCWSG